MSGTAFQAASISNNRQDFASLQMVIREQVSCPLTLGLPLNHDFSTPVPCAGPYKLRKVSPSNPAGVLLGVDEDAERTKLGSYKIRASCVSNQLQVMVESTKKDPITRQLMPPRDLFAGAGGNGLCSQFFTGETCPAGQVVTGIANGIPVCSASCPAGEIQTGTNGGVPVCSPSGCPVGQALVGRIGGLQGGAPVCSNSPASVSCPAT